MTRMLRTLAAAAMLLALTSGGECARSSPIPAEPPPENTRRSAFIYGLDFVPVQDLQAARSLGAEVVSQTFDHDGSPDAWTRQLDAAREAQLKVIAWLWPEGWKWDGEAWVIDAQARSFLNTAAGHPALFAVYVLNEPYWQGCLGCGYTTRQQQDLYTQIKAVQEVPLFSAVDSMDFWSRASPETVFADGVCDYCATWFYPFTGQGYLRDELSQRAGADVATARKLAPRSKIIWLMQGFASGAAGLRMPSGEEMADMARIVFASGVDGAMWYVWSFNGLYDDTLSQHPELQAAVQQVYLDEVLPYRVTEPALR